MGQLPKFNTENEDHRLLKQKATDISQRHSDEKTLYNSNKAVKGLLRYNTFCLKTVASNSYLQCLVIEKSNFHFWKIS